MHRSRSYLAIFIALLMIISSLSGLLVAINTYEPGSKAPASGPGLPDGNGFMPFQNGTAPEPTYNVSFVESGLPSGTTWSLTFNSQPGSSSTSTIVFAVVNGSYSYTINPLQGYSTTYSGSVTVSGGDKTVNVGWTQATYQVTFTETGLPSGTPWSVTIGGSSHPSSTQTITVNEPDGSYPYTVDPVSGYSASPASGTVGVSGAGQTVNIAFTSTTHTVTFTESGLDPGTSWSATMNGKTVPSTTNSISFQLSDGSYTYSIGSVTGYTSSPSSGSVTVSGADKSIAITFTKIPYSVTFTQTGLPSGTAWSVTFNGAAKSSSTGGSITFTAVSGTYSFSIGTMASYTASPSSGSITVSGSDVSKAITWSPVSYSVTFTESGLPSGTQWSVTFNTVTHTSTSTATSFSATGGTYSYSVGSLTGYTVDHQSGSVTVSGSNQNINLKWTAVQYKVTFSESGLPAGTQWTVTLGGNPLPSTSSSIQFTEPIGNYQFTVGTISGYHASQYSGSVSVSGSDVNVPVITWTVFTYIVTFTESGLSPGAQWSVTLSNGDQQPGTGTSIQMSEPNGSYTFSAYAPDYNWLAPSGSFGISGSDVSQSVSFSKASYAVTFTESGLPGGTDWSITIGSTVTHSTKSTLTLNLNDGPYNFIVGTISGYHASLYSGSFTVNGKDLSIPTIKWTLVTYTVTFSETGLTGHTKWTVTFGGNTQSANNPSDIVFNGIVNDTYSYSIDQVSGYQSSVTSGTITVDGKDYTQNVIFSQDTYAVVFSETGLAAGTSWTVTLGGTAQSSTGSTIEFQMPSASYSYTIGQVAGYTIGSSSGTVSVKSSSVTVPVLFTLIESSVTFTETGLLQGTGWSITINGHTNSSTTSAISLALPEGKYTFSVNPVVGYEIGNYTSTFTVGTSPVSISIAFKPLYYTVSFTESGLPEGTQWSVTFGGIYKSSNTSTITFSVHDDKYSYTVGKITDYHASPGSGTVTVDGKDVSIEISWNLVVYNIVFTQTGLPDGYPWTVLIDGEPYYSSSGTMIIEKQNGSYKYELEPIVGPNGGYSISPNNGTINVTGHDVSISILFTRVWAVSFSEAGLEPGVYWKVFIGSSVSKENSSLEDQTSTLTFYLPNGIYYYHIGALSGYYPDHASGIVVVKDGPPGTVLVKFSRVYYTISFHQQGYPDGLEWIPTINGVWYPTTSPYQNVSVPNGTYAIGVLPREHYAITPTSGNVTVDGNNVTINVTFTEVIFRITFFEAGLPNGTNWSVSMNGITNTTSNKSMTFFDFNGTYFYSIGMVPGYYAMPPNGTVKVDGAAVNVTIRYSETVYYVTFNETGLKPADLWYVTLEGSLKSTTGNIIQFQVPNGSYSFFVSNESGYLQSIPGGLVVVNGSNVLFNITYGLIYQVIFVQSGLPLGSEWSVTFGSVTKNSTSESISFDAVNGSYSYTIVTSVSDSDYSYSVSTVVMTITSGTGTVNVNQPSNIVLSGKITVNGESVNQNVMFTKSPNSSPGLFIYATVFAAGALIAAALYYIIRKNRGNRDE